MLDFTKEIKLNKDFEKVYLYCRIFVFLVFLFAGLAATDKILFPSAYFTLSFGSESKGTLISPRKNDGSLHDNNTIHPQDGLVFNASSALDFSDLKVRINLDNGDFDKSGSRIKIRKSHMAFLYPEGDQMTFKEGTLFKKNNEYFIVSNEKARRFSSEDIFLSMGYKKEAFLDADDVSYTGERGDDVNSQSAYPESTLFRIENEYYQLKGGKLMHFVSEKAFLTNYSSAQAIEKDSPFLAKYEIPEEFLGFSGGTLISTEEAVFVVDGKKIYAVENPETFEAMGYYWNDVLPVTSEEKSIYEEADLFTVRSAHPDGTIFFSKDTNRYFYIQGKVKREIKDRKVLSTYSKITPVTMEEKHLNTYSSCEIKKRFLAFGWYTCKTSLAQIESNPGTSYQFDMDIKKDIKIESLDTTFGRSISINNLKKSLSAMKQRIIGNYTSK